MSYDLVCACGHVEDSHRFTVGGCRSCDCRHFANASYVRWLFDVAEDMRHQAEAMADDLELRNVGNPKKKVQLLEDDMYEGESVSHWAQRIVSRECVAADIVVPMLFDPKHEDSPSVRRVRARSVRILVKHRTYRQAGKLVGIDDHSSVHYWVKGKGKKNYA